MVPLWVTILTSLGAGAVVGSVLNSLIQLFVNKQAHNHQMDRERMAYEREQQEKKRERLRLAGIEIIQATRAAELAIDEVGSVSDYFTYSDHSQWKEDIKRLALQLRSSVSTINLNAAILYLEAPDTITDPLSDVQKSFLSQSMLIESLLNLEDILSRKQDLPDNIKQRIDEIIKKFDETSKKGVDAVESFLRQFPQHLAQHLESVNHNRLIKGS